MTSAFNTLYHGTAAEAADLLDDQGEVKIGLTEIQVALTNALRKIARLEEQLHNHDIPGGVISQGIEDAVNGSRDYLETKFEHLNQRRVDDLDRLQRDIDELREQIGRA